MNLLPIIPNCQCLITGGNLRGAQVTAIRLVNAGPYPFGDRSFNLEAERVWQINRVAIWFNSSANEMVGLPLIPENRLMRIDGHIESKVREAHKKIRAQLDGIRTSSERNVTNV